MTQAVRWLAVLYVALVPIGRSGLPLNAQWGDLLFPLLVAAVLWTAPGGQWWSREDWPLAAYLTATLISALASGDVKVGLGHLAKQMYGAAIFLLFRKLERNHTDGRILKVVYAGAMAVVVATTVLVVYAPPQINHAPSSAGFLGALPVVGMVERIRGPLEAPEMLGNATLVAFALSFGLLAQSTGHVRQRWIAIVALLAAGEALTCSHSVAGFSVATALLLTMDRAPRPLRWVVFVAAFSVLALVNAASIVGPGRGESSSNFSVRHVSFSALGGTVTFPLNFYAALKQEAWMAFLDHPNAGVGPGGFTVVTEKAVREGRLTRFVRRHRPHCELTGRLAETGVLGGLSLLALWVSWVSVIGRARFAVVPLQAAAGAAVVGLLVNSLNADVMNFRFLWLSVAWAYAPAVSPEEGPAKTRRP